jgi:hypothetical protein
MHAGKLVFAQVMEFAPWHIFRRLVVKHRGDLNVCTFSCLDQILCMAFAQLTYRDSLCQTLSWWLFGLFARQLASLHIRDKGAGHLSSLDQHVSGHRLPR